MKRDSTCRPSTAHAVPDAQLQARHATVSRSRPSGSKKTAADQGMRVTPPVASGVVTRAQAAAAVAAAGQTESKLASGVAGSSRRRQARGIKPEVATRKQPQRAAKPQWR